MTPDNETATEPATEPATGYRSALLDLPGAVPADGPDAGVAAHYGDPLREQREADRNAVTVDRSNREVVRVTGPDRLSWLHSLTSQHLAGLAPMRGTEALVLSPHGHVEHHLVVADDGTATLLDVERGTGGALLDFLASMRFLLRVEPVDATGELAVLSVVGPAAVAAVTAALGPVEPPSWPDEQTAVPAERGSYPVAASGDTGVLARRMPYGVDLLVPRPALTDVSARLRTAGAPPAGIAAFEARRVADRRPRLGVDTDHRTIPHEVGWLTSAVHLDKGCYRGQETVARVQNLGRPPRRLVLLHLDGATVATGSTVALAGGRAVGVVGTCTTHHELGPVALALVKRNVPVETPLTVTEAGAGTSVAAAIDPDLGPAAPTRPAGHLRTPAP